MASEKVRDAVKTVYLDTVVKWRQVLLAGDHTEELTHLNDVLQILRTAYPDVITEMETAANA
jgi:hypothetical protein